MERSEFIAAIHQTPTSTEAAKLLKINRYQLWKLSNDFAVPLKKNQGGKGTKKPKIDGIGKIPISEILDGLHSSYQTKNLKRRLIEEEIKKDECEECGLTNWNGREINLQLHHKDGNSKNHRLKNLQLLCPNCHSQTSNFSGKNTKRKKS
jgi:5-methylcytosine-specific restriction endonuclease McrA